MSDFDDIRPYNDDEVRPAIDRLVQSGELRLAVGRLNYPTLAKWFPGPLCWVVGRVMKSRTKNLNSINDVQKVIERYMSKMIARAVSKLSHSGLEKLDPKKAYLFVSNHRDISMDPAFVDYVLYHNGFDTVRIAIGDNLLSIPFASDLMRLNKSFIVNRSAKTNREKYAASKHLSSYIHHSINVDNENIWIAQRQGRAKDGIDKTESAVIAMFAINKPKQENFADYVRELNIVPVSLSYEWDPLDADKAHELHSIENFGSYVKKPHEDVVNLARGIAGRKGHVHVAFGDQLVQDFQNKEEVVAELDRQIIDNVVLHPSNCFAYQKLYSKTPSVPVFSDKRPFVEADCTAEKRIFLARLETVREKHQQQFLEMYANPVVSYLKNKYELED